MYLKIFKEQNKLSKTYDITSFIIKTDKVHMVKTTSHKFRKNRFLKF